MYVGVHKKLNTHFRQSFLLKLLLGRFASFLPLPRLLLLQFLPVFQHLEIPEELNFIDTVP